MRALIVVLLLLVAPHSAHALPDTDAAQIRDVIESQLDAFRRDDGPGAYVHAAPRIRSMFPSETIFMQMVRSGYPPIYRNRSHRFTELNEMHAEPMQTLRIEDENGDTWVAVYQMEKQPDGTWRISGCWLIRPDEKAV